MKTKHAETAIKLRNRYLMRQMDVQIGFQVQHVIKSLQLQHFLYEFKLEKKLEFWDTRMNLESEKSKSKLKSTLSKINGNMGF